MSYDFKKIVDLELVNEVPEGANVLIETDGATMRLPSTAIKSDDSYTKEECDEKFITKPSTAEVGQTIVVKAIDENGAPTEWEAADFPSGGGASPVVFKISYSGNLAISDTALATVTDVVDAYMAGNAYINDGIPYKIIGFRISSSYHPMIIDRYGSNSEFDYSVHGSTQDDFEAAFAKYTS